LHFTAGESVVTGDCCLNLSGSAIKLRSFIISSVVRKGYKSTHLHSLTQYSRLDKTTSLCVEMWRKWRKDMLESPAEIHQYLWN